MWWGGIPHFAGCGCKREIKRGGAKVQGRLPLNCPCVMSDGDGDKVVSLLEAAVSSSWSLWVSCT